MALFVTKLGKISSVTRAQMISNVNICVVRFFPVNDMRWMRKALRAFLQSLQNLWILPHHIYPLACSIKRVRHHSKLRIGMGPGERLYSFSIGWLKRVHWHFFNFERGQLILNSTGSLQMLPLYLGWWSILPHPIGSNCSLGRVECISKVNWIVNFDFFCILVNDRSH